MPEVSVRDRVKGQGSRVMILNDLNDLNKSMSISSSSSNGSIFLPLATCSLTLFVCLLFLGMGYQDQSIDKVVEGNRLYQENKYEDAINKYKEALNLNPLSAIAAFNMGVAKYKQGYYASAINDFNAVIAKKDSALEAKAYYNLGNAFFKANMFKQAAHSFKEAVRLNSDDMDARHNLEIALARLKTLEKERPGFYAGDIPNPLISKGGMETEALSSEEVEAKADEGAMEFQKEEPGKVGAGNAKKGWRGFSAEMSKNEAARILDDIRDKEIKVFKDKMRLETFGAAAPTDW